MGRSVWLLLGLLSLLWGGSFYFAEIAVRDFEPLTVVTGRVVIAALALQIVVRASGHSMPRGPGRWLTYLVMGSLNNIVPFTLIVWGQKQITGGLASILVATAPLFAALLAHVVTDDERLTSNRFLGVGLGLAGAIVLIGAEALNDLGSNVIAQLAVLGAALSYACAALYGRRFRAHPPLVNATAQVTCSALIMVVVGPLIDRPWQGEAPSLGPVLAVVGLALLSTVIGYVIYYRLLTAAGATNLLLVNFLIPPSAILLGALFLNERLAPVDALGMLLIALGLAAIDGRLLRRVTPARLRPASSGG
jgi:drug/metabolite transporter (DMT)-like permease